MNTKRNIKDTLLIIGFFIAGFQANAQDLFELKSLGQSGVEGYRSAHGVSLADFDNDGDDDLLILYDDPKEKVRLLRNDGNLNFIDVSMEAGIDINLKSRVAVWFDADNDGWLDVLIGSSTVNQFYRNNGDGTFQEIPQSTGIESNAFSMSFVVGDLNGDQWLDVYAANLFEENQLWLNHGGLKFFNHVRGSGAEVGKLQSMGSVLIDVDQDNDLDIYCVYDRNEPNKLLINNGSAQFNNEAAISNVDVAGFGMGVDFADFDQNGKYDFYLSYFHRNHLLMQDANDLNFTNLADSMGVSDASMSWGVVAADFNNDTYSDIYLANGIATSGINKLFLNKGNGSFDESANGSLINPSNSLSVASSDLDGDGKLDLVVANHGENGLQVFQNIQEDIGNWLDVNLVGRNSNKFGVGAQVQIVCDGSVLMEDITVGSGYSAQNSMTIHFGLGQNETVEQMNILWPDGSIDTYTQVGSNQRLLAIQGNSLEVFKTESYRNELTQTSSIPQPVLDIPTDPAMSSGYSIARIWNEFLLDAIRNDYARPTVHARNLFHVSMAMYDAWAAYREVERPFFLGNTSGDYYCQFDGVEIPEDVTKAQEEAISYAVYRILSHRFQDSPSANSTLLKLSKLFTVLGYDENYTSIDYSTGSAAALGNYLAEKIIEFGLTDGANEQLQYTNAFYSPRNEPFFPSKPGSPGLADPNHWQPLAFESFVDQSGNTIGGGVPEFLSAEWGNVIPFSLKESDRTAYQRNGNEYSVYYDPGAPPKFEEESYKWNFSLVAHWSSHLDPYEDLLIDISPNSQGDLSEYPISLEELKEFYSIDGGNVGQGYEINPSTGTPYEPQLVRRGDFTRVLAEFWADGPESETPPGHWFTILNYVSDHPMTTKKFKGKGELLSDLEWDVKSYFSLAGAMHDAAIAAWGIKGYYDYIRPISAIRYMCEQGQSSDVNLPNYNSLGIPLLDGYVELIKEGDPLLDPDNENLNGIKLKAWLGPEYIEDPETDIAGVGWVKGLEWVPYQRATFVTPPFAGYVSGHSTFSRAAAVVLSSITGSEFFPGGMSEFKTSTNDFLVFEEGPSQDITLQWAKYKDAADQCSLSRIWGGIHPPVDDIPGRIIGEKVGNSAFELAASYYENTITSVESMSHSDHISIYPNPVINGQTRMIYTELEDNHSQLVILDLSGNIVLKKIIKNNPELSIEIDVSGLESGLYLVRYADITKRLFILNN